MRKRFSSLLAILLIAAFVACGLVLPSAFLRWEQEKLTAGTVTVQKADVSPYEPTEIDPARIGRLLALLSRAAYLSGTLYRQVDMRPADDGELSAAEADAVGRAFLSTVSNTVALNGGIEFQWDLYGAVSYAFSDAPELSFWQLRYLGTASDGETLLFTLLLDSASGLPLLLVLEGEYVSDESALLAAVSPLYASQFDLWFGALGEEDITYAVSEDSFSASGTPDAVKDVKTDTVIQYEQELLPLGRSRYVVYNENYQLESQLYVSEEEHLVMVIQLGTI